MSQRGVSIFPLCSAVLSISVSRMYKQLQVCKSGGAELWLIGRYSCLWSGSPGFKTWSGNLNLLKNKKCNKNKNRIVTPISTLIQIQIQIICCLNKYRYRYKYWTLCTSLVFIFFFIYTFSLNLRHLHSNLLKHIDSSAINH